MKKCKVCLEEKELEMFDKVTDTTVRSTCRKCRNVKNLGSWLKREGNYDKRKEYNREYMANKYQNDPDYKKYNELVRRARYLIINNEYFRESFISKFTEGMTWELFISGKVEVDHIISALKMIRMGYKDCEINNIINLRPLWKEDNRGRNKIGKNTHFNTNI